MAHVVEHLDKIFAELKRPSCSIPLDQVRQFIKSCGEIRVVKYRSLEQEFTQPNLALFRTFSCSRRDSDH